MSLSQTPNLLSETDSWGLSQFCFEGSPHVLPVLMTYFSPFPHVFPSRFILDSSYTLDRPIQFGEQVSFSAIVGASLNPGEYYRKGEIRGWIIGYHDSAHDLVEFTVLACCEQELRIVFLIVPWTQVATPTPPLFIPAFGKLFWKYIYSAEIGLCGRALLQSCGIVEGWGPTGGLVHSLLVALRSTPFPVITVRNSPSLSLVSSGFCLRSLA